MTWCAFAGPDFELRFMNSIRWIGVTIACLTAHLSHAAEPTVTDLYTGATIDARDATRGESVRITEQGEHVVTNVDRPSLLAFLPPSGSATCAGVVVCPGGGHRELWMDHEGMNVGHWLAAHGVAAFVVKYRLALAEHSTYRVEVESLADVQRAIRLVRSKASDWEVDPARVGVIGFSAGGELAARAAIAGPPPGSISSTDTVDKESAAPAFQALIYPGNAAIIAVEKTSPPAFMICGENDRDDIVNGVTAALIKFRQAGVPAELHIYAGTPHGFGIRESNHGSSRLWPEEFLTWLMSNGFLAAKKS